MRVSAGDWIKVPVQGDPWPVRMSIGSAAPEFAFVEHELVNGEVRTIAQRRCPNLPAGSYQVVVHYDDGTVVERIRVA